MALPRANKSKQETLTVEVSDINWIKDALSSMQKKLQDVDVTLVKLNQTVVGDKNYGQIGLIEQVGIHKEYIEKDKDFKSKIIGGGLVIGVFWTVILKFWDNIIK